MRKCGIFAFTFFILYFLMWTQDIRCAESIHIETTGKLNSGSILITPENTTYDVSDTSSGRDTNQLTQVILGLNTIAGFTHTPDFLNILSRYLAGQKNMVCQLQSSIRTDHDLVRNEFYQSMFSDVNLHKMQSAVNEWLSLIGIIMGSEISANHQEMINFIKQRTIEISRELLNYHPGIRLINSSNLRQKYQGKGIKIAVLDSFDDQLFDSLKIRFPKATIMPVKKYGNPVQLDHGLIVIEKILEVAPEATIFPVSYESHLTDAALVDLIDQPEIHLINLSRGFPDLSGPDNPTLKLFGKLMETNVLVKSIGNHGLTLNGILTPERLSRQLGPVGSLDQDDIYQIKTFLSQFNNPDSLPGIILALNARIFENRLSLSSGVPGDDFAAQFNSLTVPADGLWSEISTQYESGTSFSAPQITGLLALLGEHLKSSADPRINHRYLMKYCARALLITAQNQGVSPYQSGRGWVQGDLALRSLANPDHVGSN